jgi:hypothetical protein
MPARRMTAVAPVAAEGLAARVGPDPAIVTNARVLEFYNYWLAKRGSHRFPRRADIEPTEIPQLLSGIVLLDVYYDPLDFEYRLIGGDVQKRSGNLKGKRVRQASLLNASSPAYRNYCEVIETGVPQFLEGAALGAYRPGRPTLVSRVHCPLSDNDQRINKLISYLAFLDAGAPAATPPRER